MTVAQITNPETRCKLTNAELRQQLITTDFGGKEVKEAALKLLLDRAIEGAHQNGYENGYINGERDCSLGKKEDAFTPLLLDHQGDKQT